MRTFTLFSVNPHVCNSNQINIFRMLSENYLNKNLIYINEFTLVLQKCTDGKPECF